jgi:hypothetical protein
MRFLNLVTVSVFIALALASVHAEDKNSLRIHVPFPFVAAGKALPPGDYILQASGESGMVIVHGAAGSVALLTRSTEPKQADEPGVRFVSIDGQNYLDQIELTDGTARATLSHFSK